MNSFIKLFVIKAESACIVLYGYLLPDDNQERAWTKKCLDKKMKLYQLTCVMTPEQCSIFTNSLTENNKTIPLTDDFYISSGFCQRPDVIYYPSQDFSEPCKSLLKDTSYVEEYWNLNKTDIITVLCEIYNNKSLKEQRRIIHDVLCIISKETSLDFIKTNASRLGNIELYKPVNQYNSFDVKNIVQNIDKLDKCTIGVSVYRRYMENDVTVHCRLGNASCCILDRILHMNKNDKKVEFIANEPISDCFVEIWDNKTGELIYHFEGSLIRQIIMSAYIENNSIYHINDSWTDNLKKSFNGNSTLNEKLERVKKVKKQTVPDIIQVGKYNHDKWHEAANIASEMVQPYEFKSSNGAFCKKYDNREGEMDSFIKILEYLNNPNVKRVKLVDPYFSIYAMQKLLARITNTELELEIITSLSDINPDVDDNSSKDENYIDKVKDFIQKNKNLFHKKLRIINVTHNKKTAIHDRYLLREFKNGHFDGYLLSNSLNSAGKNYSFVIAAMDTEVMYDVLEYVYSIKDEELQKSKIARERLTIDVLFDNLNGEPEKIKEPKPEQWESEMKRKYGNDEDLELKELLSNGWTTDKNNAKLKISKLCWYLYNSNNISVDDCVNEILNNSKDINTILDFCDEIALEWEKNEVAIIEVLPNKEHRDEYLYRQALDSKSSQKVKINAQYLLQEGIRPYYRKHGYIQELYEIIYKLNIDRLFSLMDKTHSPMIFYVLWKYMSFGNPFIEKLYCGLIKYHIKWVNECAYHYAFNKSWSENDINIKYDVLNNLLQHSPNLLAYQYAVMLERLTFNIKQITKVEKDCANKELDVKTKELQLNIVKHLNEHTNSCDDYFFHLLVGPDNEINCHNLVSMVDLSVIDDKLKEMFAGKMIDILNKTWNRTNATYYYSDYYVTYVAAYGCFVLYGCDINKVNEIIGIDKKYFYKAIEPGFHDMHYSEWNKHTQKALWQILFLLYYMYFLKQERGYDYIKKQLKNVVSDLMVLRKKASDWHDTCGLNRCIDEAINLVEDNTDNKK